MFFSLIEKRRSVRKFLDKKIEDNKINYLIEAALRAPSSRSLNPWEFIIVDNKEILNNLAYSKQHGSSFLKEAPLGVVVCADPAKCDVWVEDCSIASIYLILAAESLGLGNCWIQIRKRMHNDDLTSEEFVRNILNIPSNYQVESIIAIGYPGEDSAPHSKEELDYKKIHKNIF